MSPASGPEESSPAASMVARQAAVSGLVTLALAIVGPVSLVAYSVETGVYLLAGAAAWALAVALKMGGGKLVGRTLDARMSAGWRAAASGAWSALTELGFTVPVFLAASKPLPLLDVFAVGLGAAAIEIVYLAVAGSLSRPVPPAPPPEWIEGAQRSLVIRHIFFTERMVASAGHIAARALIYLSVLRRTAGPGLLAFIAFAGIDGAAQYGESRGWNRFSPLVASYYYGGVFAAVMAEAAVFFVYLPK